VPYSLLSALLSLSIPPPTTKDDVARCVSDLETKKAWFEANSAKKTQEEIARVEVLVKKMQKKNAAVLGNGGAAEEGEDDDEEALQPEVGGGKEPTHSELHVGFCCDWIMLVERRYTPFTRSRRCRW
jgi:hypothetical protein